MNGTADFATRVADVLREPRADLEMTAILLAIGVIAVALLILTATLVWTSVSARRAARRSGSQDR